MRIAVTSQDLETVTPHAGATHRFLVYQADGDGGFDEVGPLDLDEALAMKNVEDPMPHPLDAVDVLIVGSCGKGIVRRLALRGVATVPATSEDPETAVRDFLAGKSRIITAGH